MWFSRQNRSRKSRRSVQPFTLPSRWNARPRLEALDERVVPAFFDSVNYAVGTYPNAVVTGDFNNDAVDDLAFANWGDGTVSVLLGNGDGTFDPAISSPAGNSPTSLAAGDFNDDGMLDLVTGEHYSSSNADVTVLLGNGNGTFQTPTGYDMTYSLYGSAPYSVAAGDVNGDGRIDIIATANDNTYSYYSSGWTLSAVLLGTGTGTFGAPLWSRVGQGFPGDAAVADVNGDGRLDIATTTDYYGYVQVALGDGTGYFGDPSYYYTGDISFSLIATDLNDDGNVDLAAANYYFGTVDVLLGTGSGTFSGPHSYAAASYPSSLATADFDGDGNVDLIATNSRNATVRVLLGTGTGAFRPHVDAAVGSTPWGVVAGDFNGDGLMDAASANNSSHNVSILINDGDWSTLNSPLITINDVTVTEGNTGTVNATFTVSLSAASSQTVTVHYATADGSATTAGGDYQATSGTLTFAPGETRQTITVPVNGDRLGEPNETFVVNFSSPTDATIADGQGVGIIRDDEPRISVSDVTKYEGKRNRTTLFTFTVTLSAAYDEPVTMSYRTVDGTATTGDNDYVAKSGTITFAPGETTKTITITVKGDSKKEANEYFYLDLFDNSANSLFTKNRGVGKILNDN